MAHPRLAVAAGAAVVLALVGFASGAAGRGNSEVVPTGDQFAADRQEAPPVAPVQLRVPVLVALPAPAPAPAPAVAPVPAPAVVQPMLQFPAASGYAAPVVGISSLSSKNLDRARGRPESPQPYHANIFDRQTPMPRPGNATIERPLTTLTAGFVPVAPVTPIAPAPPAAPGAADVYGAPTAEVTAIRSAAVPIDLASLGSLSAGGDLRGDAVYTSSRIPNLGDVATGSVFFKPATIPVRGEPLFGMGGRSTVEAGTEVGNRLFLEADTTTALVGDVRGFAQVAGFARSDGSTGTEVPHLYAQVRGFVVGKLDTFFSDPAAFPNQIDLSGPNALVYLQHPVIGYVFGLSDWGSGGVEAGLSLEKPEPDVTPPDPDNADNFSGRSRIPDVAGRLKVVDAGWGHVQVAGLVRDVGIENVPYTTGSGATDVRHPAGHWAVLGWGVQCTGMVRPFETWDLTGGDWIGFGGICGRGIAHYNNDLNPLPGLDAVFDNDGRLHALPLWSYFVSYTHQWPFRLRSTIVYSEVNLDSIDSPDLVESPYRRGRYFAANLVYTWHLMSAAESPQPGTAFAGIEYLYGRKELLDGKTGDAYRLQFAVGVHY